MSVSEIFIEIKIFSGENARLYTNVVCKVAAILFSPQFARTLFEGLFYTWYFQYP